MLGGISVLSLVIVGVVVVAAAVLAVLHFRFGVFRHRTGRRHGRSSVPKEGRIEVLESTYVDDDRRLVLVRCDRIEHLIMVGGPADLVVENDVKKVRGPGAPAPKSATAEAGRAAGGLAESLASTGSPASDRPAAAERRAVSAPRSAPAPVTGGTGRANPPASADAGRAEPASEQRQRPGEGQFGRRDTAQQRRTIQPKPLGGNRPPEAGSERQASQSRSAGRNGEDAPPLPAAGVPWAAEPDSIENEIVRALRFDPAPRTGGGSAATPRPPVSSKGSDTDPSTTLGDLADRLEEALAEEVQAASQGGRALDPESDEFGFHDQAARSGQSGKPSEQKGRPARKETQRTAPDQMAPSPEPERRRESSGSGERREEAPVISLNARRRESVDPLEDEMARLLGELTGDTKGR
jgi:hypothetical protein